MSRIHLPPPSKTADLKEALSYQFEANRQEHAQKAVHWTLTHLYLQGIRRIRVAGQGGAAPTPTFHDTQGRRRVRYEKVLQMRQTEFGRLMSLDLGPAVKRLPGVSLDSLRGTSISQTVLDNFYVQSAPESWKASLIHFLLDYGTAGLAALDGEDPKDKDDPSFGVETVVVPPWELRPLPAEIIDPLEAGGIIWTRPVPLDWLRKMYGHMLTIPRQDKDMNVWEAPPGSRIQAEQAPGSAGRGSGAAASFGRTDFSEQNRRAGLGKTGDTRGKQSVKYVEMRQYWVYGERPHTCKRWIVTLGDYISADQEYQQVRPQPLSVMRHTTVGSFWGRAWVDPMIALNRQQEAIIGNHLQNMDEADRTRLLVLPMNAGLNRRNFKQAIRDKFAVYYPDLAAPQHKPQVLAAPNIGDASGRTIGMVDKMLEGLSGHGPLFSGGVPGRVDSTGAVAIIREAQDIALYPTTKSVENAMSCYYKAVLRIIRRKMRADRQIFFTRMDESVVGLKFDEGSRSVTLTENPLPDSLTLDIGVRNAAPRDRQVIKDALDGLLQQGLITPVDYKIASIKEGLDLPWANRAAYESYESAWLGNVIIFGDGETPGEYETNENFDNHAIGLAVVEAMMASPLMVMASDAVQMAFISRKNYHLTNLGAFPEQMVPDQFQNVMPPDPGVAEAMAGPPAAPPMQGA